MTTLTIGMATFDDFDGLYFTVQSLRLHHWADLKDCEILVVDNNPDGEDGKTVRGMDVLFPKIGEIIGGSEREASLEKLEQRIDELKMSRKNLEWYIDTRRYGTVPHSGFGLGFERLLLFVTGMANIRDVIPFPRTPKNAEF